MNSAFENGKSNQTATWRLLFGAWLVAGVSTLGWLFAAFHVLLIAGVIPESIRPCTQGVPCSEKVIEWFGFMTIPVLALVAFSTIIALLVLAYPRDTK